MVRVAAETHEGQGVFVLRVVGGAQQFHADYLRIEVDGALEIANAQHGVEDFHGGDCRPGGRQPLSPGLQWCKRLEIRRHAGNTSSGVPKSSSFLGRLVEKPQISSSKLFKNWL